MLAALSWQHTIPAVAVDDVYMAASTSTLFALSNVGRIEVLRGPQGTLFGRNAMVYASYNRSFKSGGFYHEPGNRVKEHSYTVVNGEVRWTEPDERYTLRVWTRNLLDEEYFTQVSASSHDQFGPGDPLTFGGSVTFSF